MIKRTRNLSWNRFRRITLRERVQRYLIPSAVLLVLVSGVFIANARVSERRRLIEERLQNEATNIARTLDPEGAKELSFSSRDKESPVYRRYHRQIASYAGVRKLLAVYTVAFKGGKLLFGPESLKEGASLSSPPGTVYRHAPGDLFRLFSEGAPLSVGPYTDEYGTFVSAFAPVKDPRSGRILMAVGVDMDIREWSREVQKTRWGTLAATLLFAILLSGGYLLLMWRNSLPVARQRSLRHTEVFLVVLIGLSVTALFSFLGWETENRSRNRAFNQLVDYRASLVREKLRDFQTRQLTGLARFLSGEGTIDRERFAAFVEPLTNSPAVHGVGWVPRVFSSERERFERERLGRKIFQFGPSNRPVPVPEKEVYFPLLYIEPLAENQGAIGYEISSEGRRAAALHESLRDSLPTASAPVYTANDRQKVIMVYYPLFSRGRGSEGLKGVALMSLKMEILLQEASKQLSEHYLEKGLYLLNQEGVDERVSLSHRVEDGDCEFEAAFPLFYFGQSYLLAFRSGSGFMSLFPKKEAELRVLLGTSLTLLLSAFVGVLTSRQYELLWMTAIYEAQREATPDSTLVEDNMGRWVKVNRRMADLTEFTPEELLSLEGRALWIKLASRLEDPEGFLRTMGERESTRGKVHRGEITFLDGRCYVYSSSPIMGDENAFYGWLWIFHDITQERETQRSLHESEERFRVMVENLNEVIFSLDKEGRFTYISPKIERFTGYTAEEAVGRGFFEFVHPDDLSSLQEEFEKALGGKSASPFEFRIFSSDEGTRYVYTSSSPFYQDGKLEGLIGVMGDTTERKRLEEQLRQKQKMEAVGQLTGGVAHDFNNLLQVINGYTELILKKTDQQSPLFPPLEMVAKAGNRAAGLVGQLLAFSRRQILRPETLDMNEVVSGLLKMLKRILGENIRILFTPGYPIGTVFADRGQIEQVVMNLCLNARDAMPQGGTLSLEVSQLYLDQEYCLRQSSGTKPGLYILLSVSDTGIGMDHETLQHIFEPFFTTKKLGRGTGLGLSTVYGIVQQHNGIVNVYSEVKKGTNFKIYLPMGGERGEKPKLIGNPEEVSDRGGEETILLAEDDPLVREFNKSVLEEAGYLVICAEDGEEAVRLFQEHREEIDLAVLDIVMPGLGGGEVYARLFREKPTLSFLFTSGYSNHGIHTAFVLEEGFHFLQKPFTSREFLRKVREAIESA